MGFKDNHKICNFFTTYELYELVRKYAYDNHITVSEVFRRGVELLLSAPKK